MAEDAETEVKEPVVVRAQRSKERLLSEEEDAENVRRNMKQHFADQPRVSIKTREDERVQINDYIFIIKGGEKVDVPQDVATILEEAGRI